jgi:hypothetical protein
MPTRLVRRTQKPFSALWKVTRSTRPARASWVGGRGMHWGHHGIGDYTAHFLLDPLNCPGPELNRPGQTPFLSWVSALRSSATSTLGLPSLRTTAPKSKGAFEEIAGFFDRHLGK